VRARPDVSIIIVAHDSAEDLALCLPAALAQDGVRTEVVVIDNASADDSARRAERLGARLLSQPMNRGFAGGANAGIDGTDGRYVLTLNPDCRISPGFCAALVERLDRDDARDVGSASGRILRAEGVNLAESLLVDSTGIVFTSSGRHLDRDSGMPAASSRPEGDVSGVTGAAGFYRRAALESVRISTGCFDEDFFLYREDADLALRLRRAGWRCLYVPSAGAFHRRRNLPDRRRKMTAVANMHSVKNRFLLRVNNSPVAEFRFLPTLLRDAAVVGACLTIERSSLPAFGYLWRNRRRLAGKREEIRSKRR
jgi:GT2 family glycosyltransferase